MENKILTTKEVANYLRMSPQTIDKKRKNKELPYFKIGRNVFFNKDKIDLWIHNKEMENLQQEDNQTEVKSIGD